MLPVGMQYISSGLTGTCGSGDCYDTLWLTLDKIKAFFRRSFVIVRLLCDRPYINIGIKGIFWYQVSYYWENMGWITWTGLPYLRHVLDKTKDGTQGVNTLLHVC